MRTLIAIATLAIITSALSPSLRAEDMTTIPHEMMVEIYAKLSTTKKLGGEACIPLYLKHAKDGVVLDAKMAKFRMPQV
jgi:hypothetical protein